jgi:hypothetical protein
MASFEIDPLVKQLSVEQIELDIKSYQSILDSSSSTENDLHQFLANHSYFFNTRIRLGGVSPLYSKIKLGSEHEVDFAFFDTGSFGPEWVLIEIESPKHSLITKTGDLSSQLNHAIKQIQDWNIWIRENLSYARKMMPLIDQPIGFVFMGRRKDLNESGRKILKATNHSYRHTLRIHTLDSFIDGARSVINLVEKKNCGDWWLPMKALPHSDLAKGLPTVAQDFFSRWANEEERKHWQKEILRERNQLDRSIDWE